MINRKYFSIFLIFVLTVFQNCDDDWIFDVPDDIPEFVVIDSTSYDDWIYYSLELGEINITNPENSIDWDMAFKRNNIKTNGGESGSGEVCAIVDDTQSWTSDSFSLIEEISKEECQYDEFIEGNIFTYQGCYNNHTHLFEGCEKNPALDHWGYFDDSYNFNINNYQFFVRRVNGDYVKIWLMSYSNFSGGESGHIYMAYLPINEQSSY